MREYRIAAIPGDGIGSEVIEAGIRVLDSLVKHIGGFNLSITHFPWGTDFYLENGKMMPDDGLEQLKKFGMLVLELILICKKVLDLL